MSLHLSFLGTCVSGEVEMMGGRGLVMSLTQGRMTEAVFWLLLVPRALFITSLCHIIHGQSIQEKKLQFYSVILLLSDRVREDGTTV